MSDLVANGTKRFWAPLDINTIIILLVFVGGAVMSVANTNAQTDATRTEMARFEQQTQAALDRLTSRIDTVVDRAPVK